MVSHPSHRSLSVSLAIAEQRAPTPKGALAAGRGLADAVSERIAREFILSDLIDPGSPLPSSQQLADRYGVSRVTIRAGLRSLKEAGLISLRQGARAIVLPRGEFDRFRLDRLASLETFATEAGVHLTTSNVDVQELGADEVTARLLELAVGDPVYVVWRTKLLDGAPVAVLLDYVRRDALALELVQDEAEDSMLDALLRADWPVVDHADCAIDAIELPSDVASRLGVDEGATGLLLEEVVRTVGGAPLVRSLAWHRRPPEIPRFVLQRRRRVGD